MSTDVREYITEINQNYNELGEDLLMLESILLAAEGKTGFPEEYVESSLKRLWDYTCQHLKEIRRMTNYLITPPQRGTSYFPRIAQK